MAILNLDNAIVQDLELDENTDYTLELDLFESDGETEKNFDLSSAKCEFRKDINGSADISFAYTTDITCSGNTITWVITDAKTAGKGGNTYFYCLEITSVGGLKSNLIKGIAVINEKAG